MAALTADHQRAIADRCAAVEAALRAEFENERTAHQAEMDRARDEHDVTLEAVLSERAAHKNEMDRMRDEFEATSEALLARAEEAAVAMEAAEVQPGVGRFEKSPCVASDNGEYCSESSLISASQKCRSSMNEPKSFFIF
jgi:hypothetical protein